MALSPEGVERIEEGEEGEKMDDERSLPDRQ